MFIDDDHLAVLHHVFDVFLVEAIGFEQLRDDVDALRFGLEIGLHLGLQVQTLAQIGLRAGVDFVERGHQVRQHEGIRILRFHVRAAFFGQIGFVGFLLNREEQLFFLGVERLFALIGVQLQLGGLHEPQILGILEHFHEPGGLRRAEAHFVEQ